MSPRHFAACAFLLVFPGCSDDDPLPQFDAGVDAADTTSGDTDSDVTADVGADAADADQDVAVGCSDSVCASLGRSECDAAGVCGPCLDGLEETETDICCGLGQLSNTAGDTCLSCPVNADSGAVCSENGACLGGADAATCACDPGFEGDACENASADACTSEPCGDGGACSLMDDGFSCACFEGFEGDDCTACRTVGVAPESCVAANAEESDNCTRTLDGAPTGGALAFVCEAGENSAGCVDGAIQNADIGYAFDSAVTLSSVRLLSDWWSKRPTTWEVWTSDSLDVTPDSGATLVASAAARVAPWQCVTGEACDDNTPDHCCPDGRDQAQRIDEGALLAKYDQVSFAATEASVWWVRATSSASGSSLLFMETEFRSPQCDTADACAANPCFSDEVTCTNTAEGYICGACPSGLEGDGESCSEADGCASNPCFAGVTCTDVPAPGTGATCGPCPTGFTGNGRSCTPIPEPDCVIDSDCGSAASDQCSGGRCIIRECSRNSDCDTGQNCVSVETNPLNGEYRCQSAGSSPCGVECRSDQFCSDAADRCAP